MIRDFMDISKATERDIWKVHDAGMITSETAWYWIGKLRRGL